MSSTWWLFPVFNQTGANVIPQQLQSNSPVLTSKYYRFLWQRNWSSTCYTQHRYTNYTHQLKKQKEITGKLSCMSMLYRGKKLLLRKQGAHWDWKLARCVIVLNLLEWNIFLLRLLGHISLKIVAYVQCLLTENWRYSSVRDGSSLMFCQINSTTNSQTVYKTGLWWFSHSDRWNWEGVKRGITMDYLLVGFVVLQTIWYTNSIIT